MGGAGILFHNTGNLNTVPVKFVSLSWHLDQFNVVEELKKIIKICHLLIGIIVINKRMLIVSKATACFLLPAPD